MAAPSQASSESRDRSRSPRSAHDSPRGLVVEAAATTSPTSAALGMPPALAPPSCVVPSYSQVKPTDWEVRRTGQSSMGSPTICIQDKITRTAPVFCLYEREECGTLVFPLEPRKEGEMPAFMTGATPTRKVESLDLTTTLEGEQTGLAKNVDDWVKQQALENAKDWFGRACSRTEIEVMYSSPLKIDPDGRYAPNLRAKMNLGGIDKFLTQVTFVRAAGGVEEGAGWEFVEPRLGEHKWRQHRARVVLEARRIWIVGKKFGLTYSITNIAVREKAEARPNPFASDSTVRD